MSNRKLQAEIDRTLKRIGEGIESFDEIWEKVYSASAPALKEKYEGELKKEIKKLQRHRDQVKSWIGNGDIKNKEPLLEARRQVEVKMEQFKQCERETKTKPYSKEGLQADTVDDPYEPEKAPLREWIDEQTTSLDEQVEAINSELEGLSRRGRKQRGERVEELEDSRDWHQHHLRKLALLRRLLDADKVRFAVVEDMKDAVEYYVNENGDPDFYEDEYMYEELDKAAKENKVIHRATKDKEEDAGRLAALAESSEPVVVPSSPTVGASSKKDEKRKKDKANKQLSKKERREQERREREAARKKREREAAAAAAAAAVPPARSMVNQQETFASKIKKQQAAAAAQQQAAAAAARGNSNPGSPNLRANGGGNAANRQQGGQQQQPQQQQAGQPGGQQQAGQPGMDGSGGGGGGGAAGAQQLDLLFTSMRNLPSRRDTDVSKAYHAANPYRTPAYYPHTPNAVFENPAVFEKFDTDTLFFIFYYRQGTYQQFLAARELKKQSWRYHRKYLTWFQRHEEPKVITDEYEQGTYVYFDYETGWCQRKKNDFTFEYRYLEDDPLNLS